MSNCHCHHSDSDSGSSNSGFIFGLICGAIIGAVIAVIIYKNNKTEVFEKLEQKIKSFFKDLIPQSESAKNQKPSPKKIIVKSLSEKTFIKPETKAEITPIFVKAKKPVPKTFIKPKK